MICLECYNLALALAFKPSVTLCDLYTVYELARDLSYARQHPLLSELVPYFHPGVDYCETSEVQF